MERLRLHEIQSDASLQQIHLQSLRGSRVLAYTMTKLHMVANQQPFQIYTSPFLMLGRYGLELRDPVTDHPMAICSYDFGRFRGHNVATVVQTPQGFRPDRRHAEITSADRARFMSMDYDPQLISQGTAEFCRLRNVAAFRVNMLKGLVMYLRLSNVMVIRVISARNNHLKVSTGHVDLDRAEKIIDMPAAVLGFQKRTDENWWLS